MKNLIALAIFTMCLGVAVGGIVLIRSENKRHRWSGLLFAVLAIACALLLALMSSKYWFGNQVFYNAFIDIEIVALFVDLGKYLLALLLGSGIATLLYLIVRRSLQQKQRWWLGVISSVVILLGIMAFGTNLLIVLSIPEAEKDTNPIGRPIEVTHGFTVELFSSGSMISPTALAFGPDGQLYAGDIRGRIWRMSLDQRPVSAPKLFADGYNQILGLAWRGNELYVASLGTISVISDANSDGQADQRQDIVKNLPVHLFPLHQNNNIRFGPDGRLYFGLGAGNNNAQETNSITGTILSVNPDGSDMRVVARGLRNAYAVAFNATGDLFATENGPQGIPVIPGDELNQIEFGKDYGYPGTYDLPPPQSDTVGPVYLFPPHASPDGLVFYNGSAFPAEYTDNAFVASWMRGEIYRLRLDKGSDGVYTTRASIFATGFKNPLDIVVGPDGNLYISDFGVSAIYRVARSDAPTIVVKKP